MEKATLRGAIVEVRVLEKSTKEAEVRDASVHAPNATATIRILTVSFFIFFRILHEHYDVEREDVSVCCTIQRNSYCDDTLSGQAMHVAPI